MSSDRPDSIPVAVPLDGSGAEDIVDLDIAIDPEAVVCAEDHPGKGCAPTGIY